MPSCRFSSFSVDFDGHILDLGVFMQSILAELATESGLLEAAEGRLIEDGLVAIDPDRAGVERVGDFDCLVDVAGEYARCQSIRGRVGSSHRLVEIAELGNEQYWSQELVKLF